jgi:hypothetical protein
MAAPTCLYTDPKNPEGGPRLYLSFSRGWVEDPQQAGEYSSLSTARSHQVPIGYLPSQPVLAEVIKVHPAVLHMRALVSKVQELFPAATVTPHPPLHHPRFSWFLDVLMPPDKRSFVIEYRPGDGHYLMVFGTVGTKMSSSTPFVSEDQVLLQAIDRSEPLTCACDCHGPSDGFFHCWDGVCCNEPNLPRSNVDRAARA